ncbi:hypothetical protein M9H77_31467 [Catharanthus roseus]|uniref:Uncharacterized protein n=1 Tax=Catharanthus roseus TaxID=4058 RepID=A0ACC0A062_CATRO|nr:hypothetical protein M9H77_31467 [Catharanthus roseus]
MYNLSTTSTSKIYVNTNIHEFFHIASDANLGVEKYCTCKVMVLNIYMNKNFYYKSCMEYYRKLVEAESKFYCANCSKDVDYPKLNYFNTILFSYMLKVLVSDKTRSAWSFLFDKEVEKVIRNNIETLVELYLKDGLTSNTLKLLMNELIAHRFVFQVKLNYYNIQRGSQMFIIS